MHKKTIFFKKKLEKQDIKSYSFSRFAYTTEINNKRFFLC